MVVNIILVHIIGMLGTVVFWGANPASADRRLRDWNAAWGNNEGMALLNDSEIEARLSSLNGWDRDGEAIVKEFDRGDFVGSVRFVESIVNPAEAMNHHPDLEISWDKVRVTISTHSEGGLTENDFDLAAKIDALA